MKFYAYKPTDKGTEPFGTQGRILFELKTRKGACRRAKRILGKDFRLFTYISFYDDKTFHEVLL